MTEIIKEKTCAVTGHRVLGEDFDDRLLRSVFLTLINMGYNTFLCGMALGFDSVCFKVLEKIREDIDIKIIACIPCKTQSYKYSYKQKKEYERMLSVSDEKIVLSEEYTPYCMQKRNMFMVDNCSVLVSYLRINRGGTFNTMSYAEKTGVKIVRI